jgi:hypothetical protein
MLFLGDSYSVGYGNVGAVLPNTCSPTAAELQEDWNKTCNALKVTVGSECAGVWQVLNENSLAAFTTVTAEAFGADYQIIATSGEDWPSGILRDTPGHSGILRDTPR